MGNLFTTHGSENKRNLSYEPGTDKFTGVIIKTVVGEATKHYAQSQKIEIERYQYFGMTETAARTCATNENAQSSGTPDGASVSYLAEAERMGNSNMWNTNVTKTSIIFTWTEVSFE